MGRPISPAQGTWPQQIHASGQHRSRITITPCGRPRHPATRFPCAAPGVKSAALASALPAIMFFFWFSLATLSSSSPFASYLLRVPPLPAQTPASGLETQSWATSDGFQIPPLFLGHSGPVCLVDSPAMSISSPLRALFTVMSLSGISRGGG